MRYFLVQFTSLVCKYLALKWRWSRSRLD